MLTVLVLKLQATKYLCSLLQWWDNGIFSFVAVDSLYVLYIQGGVIKPVLWIKIQIRSVISNFLDLDPDPYSATFWNWIRIRIQQLFGSGSGSVFSNFLNQDPDPYFESWTGRQSSPFFLKTFVKR